jgi:glucosamine-phosphate N-acetyltransferase
MMIEIKLLFGPDLGKDYFDTLASLREVSKSPEEIKGIFRERLRLGIKTFVAKIDGKVVGTITLLVEPKFYGNVGHIEDVAVHPQHQRKGIGRAMMLHVENVAREAKCYKIVLGCADKNIAFYASLGYTPRENQMRKDL